MKRLFSYLLITLLFVGCSLLEDDDKVEANDAAEFVLTEDPNYPVLGLEEDGTSYLFSDDLSNIYLRKENGDEWSLNLNLATGKPIDLYMLTSNGDYYITFSNFNNDLVDLSISKINGITRLPGTNAYEGNITDVSAETHYLLGVEFDGISNTEPIAGLKSASSVADAWNDFWLPNIKRTIGHVTAGVGCGLGLAGAGVTFAGSAGTATPFSVVMATYACGSFASGLLGDITDVKPFADISFGLAVNGTSVDCTKAVATRSASDIGSCINDLVGLAMGISTDGDGVKSVVGNRISADMNNFIKTGGLLGKWKSNDDPQTVTQNAGGYTMTTTINPLEIEFATTICNIIMSGTSSTTGAGVSQELDFKYAFKYSYELMENAEYDPSDKSLFAFAMFNIQGVTMTSQGSSIYYPWNEFKNSMAANNTPFPAEIADMEKFDSYYVIFTEDQSLTIDLYNNDDGITLYRNE
ncbi:hypothetical protein [uncultured Draconibacterium sp.]|uniref:hypothetical protein n=1 Tax=uncultured Draconibacterium sp. TaxID=1573823 RepID=UPI002AA72281|nr:hypothetical protein [uncultured Draconibacterium sp.]